MMALERSGGCEPYSINVQVDSPRHQPTAFSPAALPPKSLICTECGRSHENESELKFHLKNCAKLIDKIVKFKCFHCPRQSKWKNNLRMHIETRHLVIEKERPSCTACGKSLRNRKCLRKHRKYCDKANTSIVKYKCFHCSHETKYKHNLKHHIEMRHLIDAINRLTCTACGRSLADIQSLRKHQKHCERANSEVVKHECPICCLQTKWKRNLTRHLSQVHSIEAESLECPTCTGCGKSCRDSESLRDHKQSCKKTGKIAVKQKCPHCLYETKWKSALKKHLKKIHPAEAIDPLSTLSSPAALPPSIIKIEMVQPKVEMVDFGDTNGLLEQSCELQQLHLDQERLRELNSDDVFVEKTPNDDIDSKAELAFLVGPGSRHPFYNL